jgi:FdhD protein
MADTSPPSPSSADEPGGSALRPEWHYRDGAFVCAEVELAVETPIALEYNGISHAVMLATPCDLDDFALGFSLGEGIIASPSELYGVDISVSPQGATLALEIGAERFAGLKERRRTLAGRTGCGICGTESLDQVIRPVAPVPLQEWRLSPDALAAASQALSSAQTLSRQTGATHAAAWCDLEGRILHVREDVGRHNALDKLIGALVRARIPTDHGFAFITSRASVEMVQKAATAGMPVLAAVSGPTVLAVETAKRFGVTLLGFTRGAQFSVYAHRERIA